MDFNTIFAFLRPEFSLLAVIVILLMYDLCAGPVGRRYFQGVASVLVALHVAGCFIPVPEGELFGGMFVTTAMGTLVKAVLGGATLLVFLQANSALKKENSAFKMGEFYVLTLSTLLGMYIMISSGNFLMLYLGLETASVPLACLVAFDKYRHNSAEAGAKYILTAALSSGILLYGISMLYGTCGTLYFEDMPYLMNMSAMQIAGMAFFLVGMGFKISLVPFHLWTADVYQGAPTSITAYLSVVSKGSAAFVLMVVLFKVFAPMAYIWKDLMYGLIVVTITVANIFAVRQKDIKRFFAFSSISQAGYIMLGVIAGTPEGMTALVYYIVIYVLSNMAVFGVISAIDSRTGKVNISDYNGLYSTNPRMALVMMFALFSLAGIPPFAGFFSKFFIFAAAASQGYYILVLIALINTVISLYYYLLIVKAMFINKSENPIERFRSDSPLALSLVICMAGVFAAGIVSCIFSSIGSLSFGM